MAKERLAYIDIAKGILILFLLMGHALLFIRNEGIDDSFINGFQKLRLYLWTPYYMPAFFVITGFCSNFNKPFSTFLWQNFKTLKIPAIIFGLFLAVVTMMSHHTLSVHRVLHHLSFCVFESGLWFLDALFVAKILFWSILRINSKKWFVLFACISFFLIGFVLYKNNLPSKDYGNVSHALMLTMFLLVGQQLRTIQYPNIKGTIVWGVIYLFAIIVIMFMGIKIPFITNKISLSWLQIIPFFFLSISGSCFIISFCELFKTNAWLEFIGRNSLVFYMFNTFALNISVKLLSKYMTSHLLTVAMYLIVMVLTCTILVIITKMLNTKYLRFTLGSF